MKHRRAVLLLTLLLALLVAGCARGAATNTTPENGEGQEVATGDDPVVVIDAPASGTTIPLGQLVEISSTATGTASPVQRIEMTINGDLIADDATPDSAGQPTFSVVQRWVPVEAGRAEVTVYAYNVDGTRSEPTSIILEVADGASTPDNGSTEPVTDTVPVATTEPVTETDPITDTEPEATEESETSPTAESEEGETTEPTGPQLPAVVTAEGGLNVRATPALDGERTGGVLLGERVIAIGRSEATDWIRIRYGAGTAQSEGWVSAQFLDVEGDVATLPVGE